MTTTPLPPPVPLTGLDCYIDPKDGKVKRYDQARADLEAENADLKRKLAEASNTLCIGGQMISAIAAGLKGSNHD